MRIFLWLLGLFAAAIGLAVLARFNAGNVVFFYPPWRVDLSLNFFIVIAVLLFFTLFTVIRALRSAQRMPQRVAQYRRDKRDREANQALRESLKSLFEGRFGQAEKAASRAASVDDNSGVAALVAARAAHRLGQLERRQQWLAKASEDDSLRTARLMTEIELLVDEHHPEEALDAVRELNSSGIRHIHALRLALKANQAAKNWPEVLRLVRSLDKNNAIHPALSQRLRELAYENLLTDASHDPESIRRVWFALPAEDRMRPSIAVRGARAFVSRGLHEEASALIEKALALEWDERLVRVWRTAGGQQGTPLLLGQIERCEKLLQQHPTDPDLALTLGTFCLRQKLWGRAQRCLEMALSDSTEPETVREAHLKLAQLHEALQDQEKAASHYRSSALASIL
ncbi:heme biosynthesis protein HemY [Lacisediminimonas profundi]|uniref:heme biosynthesis protein HemY n=1 Tax=Lacisediminimonas profundi TaxID=2603856 RepID=UPI00124B0272|nr:heme biosynthesis protein HemY [Lacisediminimonas profundi]